MQIIKALPDGADGAPHGFQLEELQDSGPGPGAGRGSLQSS